MSSPLGYPGGEVADFRPTHVVPQEGLSAWESPDVSRPTVPLDPFLPVQLLSRRGEWGRSCAPTAGPPGWTDGSWSPCRTRRRRPADGPRSAPRTRGRC